MKYRGEVVDKYANIIYLKTENDNGLKIINNENSQDWNVGDKVVFEGYSDIQNGAIIIVPTATLEKKAMKIR